jgi:hypothetical protein
MTFATLLATSLSVGACASTTEIRQGCVERSDEMLREVALGRLEYCAPGVELWLREVYRDCGWVE